MSTRRSGYDGSETLRLRTSVCDLETEASGREHVWLFNGSVAGSPDEIAAILLPIVEALHQVGCSACFEIYDDDSRLVRVCPADTD